MKGRDLMSAVVLNEAGLLLAIVGGLIIFRWWRSPAARTAGEAAAETERLRQHYQFMARLGLALIIAGFVLQFVAGLLPVSLWRPLW
jgi:hypothetical protein